jgi:hypothetical protein
MPAAKSPRQRPEHLMCGTPFWGFAGVVACTYFSYLSLSHVQRGEFGWPHDAWSIVSYAVWVLLMAGLARETRCWRERVFFGLVLTNFGFGFLVSVWTNASDEMVRELRIISTGLWGAAALVSLILMFAGRPSPGLKP